jgi:hypothetical protein
MAGVDYCSCHNCGVRLFYDGEYVAREYMEQTGSAKYIVCDKCYEKLEKKITKLEASRKRGR